MKKQTVLGLFIIATGVAFFLGDNNIGLSREFINLWWPAVFIFIGLYMLWENIRNFLWPIIIITVSSILLVNNLGYADIELGSLVFPAILICIGLNITLSAFNKKSISLNKDSEDSITAILGGSTSANTSTDYTGGIVTSILGGAELDISKATIKKSATINVSIFMGGLELRIPENVKIVNRTQSILGGIEHKNRSTPKDSSPTLIIEGSIIFGGVEIKN